MAIRPRLTKEEYEIVVAYRERHKALKDECEAKGIPLEDVKHYWFKSEDFSMFVKNDVNIDDVITELIKEVKNMLLSIRTFTILKQQKVIYWL
jgi:hypothetical protein